MRRFYFMSGLWAVAACALGAPTQAHALTITNTNNITLANSQVESGGNTSANPNVVNGSVGPLLSYTATGSFLSSTFGADKLSNGDIGAGIPSPGQYAIVNAGAGTLTLDFGSTTTLTSISIYIGYRNRDDASYTLKDGAGTILGAWQINNGNAIASNQSTDSFWLTFDTPVLTDKLVFDTSKFGGESNPTVSYREIQVFTTVPEPSTAVLHGGGLLGLAARGRRRKA